MMGKQECLLFVRCPISGECLKCPFRGRSITYGPFRSRRRGMSIGINLFPGRKVCSFNCVYCFRGKTSIKTMTLMSGDYDIPPELLREALKEAMSNVEELRAIDFSGSGEPTLHRRFNEYVDVVIDFVKKVNPNISVGVFTNSSTLGMESVVKALLKLEYVEAKLDTVIQWKFKVINRPHKSLNINNIIRNLRSFRKRFSGTLVIQIMLIKYLNVVNWSIRDAELMADILSAIEPDEVHVYTAYRMPRLSTVGRAKEEDMYTYGKILKDRGLKVELYTH
ncbi:MAG: hypothetical protein B6U85_00505 [Desulfurococcales archaeon ex4484_42]|nr:MAG: hypothetical protein B6U85_00505 [Desulfurococcales archaeon ex4484_42]